MTCVVRAVGYDCRYVTHPLRSAEAGIGLSFTDALELADVGIRGLQAFMAVAELGSFRAAGDALFLDASTVSKSVTRLEATLGVKLLTRTTRKVTPTAAGVAILGPARAVLVAVDELVAAARRPR